MSCQYTTDRKKNKTSDRKPSRFFGKKRVSLKKERRKFYRPKILRKKYDSCLLRKIFEGNLRSEVPAKLQTIVERIAFLELRALKESNEKFYD